MFRLFITALLITAGWFVNTTVRGAEIEVSVVQVKNNYLTIRLSKCDDHQLEGLIYDLKSYKGKVADVMFDSSNHYLTIYYTPELALDDLLYIISKSSIDFIKISGTEL